MPFQYVFLWTDMLFYVLIILMVVGCTGGRKNMMLVSAWQYIFRRPLAMFSLVILLFFMVIAFLDSIHFYPLLYVHDSGSVYATRVQSLLDFLVAPLGRYTTETYSAPFKLFIQPITNYDLCIGIVLSLLKGLLGFLVVFFLMALMLFFKGGRHVSGLFNDASWRAIFFALFLICVSVSLSLYVSHYFYIFGTDKVGGDVFYQAIKSIRTGMVIGTLTTLLMLPFAIFFGTIAGYFGGWTDDIVQYIYTTISSIPGILLIAAAILSLQIFIKNHADSFENLAQRSDARLFMLCVVLGLTAWTDLCRLIRAETLKLREMDFVQAAVVMGVSRYKIIIRHIVPNLMHIIWITIVLNFSMLVLAETVLSYVGVGVDPSTMSWGNMINSARFELAREPVVWWPLLAAFSFMFVLVFCANLFADTLRDAFDPRGSSSRT
jgi:peptide/nickel transport system permease protein